MGKPASNTLIGVFIAGAIVLAVAAVVIFGSGRFFTKTFLNVMYFHNSVKGLNVGSPVLFRGVRIGSVKNIELRYDGKDLSFLISVLAEFDPRKMVYIGHAPGTEHTDELIKKGLRARLELQSMVTGQLAINIDFFPDRPARLLGLDTRYPEIPTIASEIDEFLNTAEQIPLKELAQKAMSALEGIDRIVNSPKVATGLDALSESLKEVKTVVRKIDSQIDPVLANMKDASDSLQRIVRKGDTLPEQMEKSLIAVQDTMKQAEKTLASAQEIASADSTLIQQVDGTLREVGDTARSVRFLTEYLHRHPEALIHGKKVVKGE
jgi:paraquat-inducible protein B